MEPLVHLPGSIGPFIEDEHYRVTALGCWEWLGSKDEKGYGLITGAPVVGERRAHRAAWTLATGEVIPKGDHIHHTCENKSCINPADLERHTHSAHLTLHRVAESPLTWDDVREIRHIHQEGGTSIFELAARYGLKKSAIHKLIKNQSWHDPDYTPGRVAVCPLLECRKTFVATKHNQRFCCADHRHKHNCRVPGGYVERRLQRAA